MKRRRFLSLAAATGSGVVASRWFDLPLFAAPADPSIEDPLRKDMSVARVAAGPGTFYRPYCSKAAESADTTSWVQVDLGSSQAIDSVKLYPATGLSYWPYPFNFGSFPARFKIEASGTADFAKAVEIVDHTWGDVDDPQDKITEYAARQVRGRYVRLTVTRMRPVPKQSSFRFAVSKLEVLSNRTDVAVLRPVSADSVYGNDADLMQLTRAPRPMGEGIVTDQPENVTAASAWKPVAFKAQAPRKGVGLEGGVLQTAVEQNIGYLLDSFTVDELLRQFRERAKRPNPPGLRQPDQFWEEDLAGSNAGRFLMGAANCLRWVDNEELRRRLTAVVDGIEQCRQPNGYIMAYPEDTIFYSERAAYTRAWVTHGLIEAGYSGNTKAFGLLRGYYDWFDQCPYLPKLMRGTGLGPQGMIANTRVYFTPVGAPEDLQVVQRYFQENYWLDQLAKRDLEAIWQYPYDRPHCYQITFFEAYLDLYRATGDERYLNAMLGAWELYHDKWEHVGGSMAVEEFQKDPPLSYLLEEENGELCGSVFWTFFNQRLHFLYPDEEKYASEIEKSIYNVGLANQSGTTGIRYFARLVGKKKPATRINTCCEGQGTRLLGSLPEHIYSVAADGVYVNLFEPSTIAWSQAGERVQLKMTTRFPFDAEVELRVATARPARIKLRVRVPSWASGEMPIQVNARTLLSGQPGSYAVLDRTWRDGDKVSFTLPMALKLAPYRGSDQIPGRPRYAVEYGPLLLAAVGSDEVTFTVEDAARPGDLLSQLTPKRGQPLHFTVAQQPEIEYLPYWQVGEQTFTCFPVVKGLEG